RLRYRRKIMPVLIWFAGINHNSRVVILLVESQGIDLAAPALPHHFEIFLGIAPCSHSPDDLRKTRRIDVLIHDDGPSISICHRNHRPPQTPRLPRMSVILLPDADHIESPARTRLVHPHTMNLGYRRLVESFPKRSRPDECALIKM